MKHNCEYSYSLMSFLVLTRTYTCSRHQTLVVILLLNHTHAFVDSLHYAPVVILTILAITHICFYKITRAFTNVHIHAHLHSNPHIINTHAQTHTNHTHACPHTHTLMIFVLISMTNVTFP